MAAVGDLVELNLFYDYLGQKLENTFGFRVRAGTPTFSQLSLAFQIAFVGQAVGQLFRSRAATLSTDHLAIRDVKPGTAATYEESYTAVVGSDAGTEELPPQCAAVVSWRTAQSGRSYHGRSYLPGWLEDRQDGGIWNSTTLTTIQDFVTNMINVFGPSGTNANWEAVVISRFNNGVKRAIPVGTPITGGIVRGVVHTQRRRALGAGR